MTNIKKIEQQCEGILRENLITHKGLKIKVKQLEDAVLEFSFVLPNKEKLIFHFIDDNTNSFIIPLIQNLGLLNSVLINYALQAITEDYKVKDIKPSPFKFIDLSELGEEIQKKVIEKGMQERYDNNVKNYKEISNVIKSLKK